MIINEISIKGYKSFGNNEQILKLNTENGELILLVGSNGNGKCVDKKTLIEIEIDDLFLNDDLINFLDETERGNRILLYIKKNKALLYERIEKYRSNNNK
jgi:predicted ATP-binding protein involved in virulence